MMKKRFVAALAVLLAGCGGSLFESQRIEYKTAAKLPTLEVPPDLTAPSRDNRYQVPDVNPTGTATYSTYSSERAGAPRAGATEVLPAISPAKVRMERAGTQRWLVVPQSPEKLWPVMKEFWQELGFLIKIEVPEAGVMETDWAENRAKIPQDFIRNALGKVLDGLYSTSERDKFRTRLERGAEPGTTEIYISHRGVEEVYTSQRQDYTVWQARPADPELEAEFLRRFMVRLGVEEPQAKVQVAAATGSDRAKIVSSQDGSTSLEIDETFDRAWRRVGLALDRVGFTVEDRDRSKGIFFVRYIDPEKDAQGGGKRDEGFLSRLMFWKSGSADPKSAEQYRVQVKDKKDSSQVEVLGKDGQPDKSEAARKILSLLQQQLK
jgi:outer membrane protein assembly factor BamC